MLWRKTDRSWKTGLARIDRCRKKYNSFQKIIFAILLYGFTLSGCSSKEVEQKQELQVKETMGETQIEDETQVEEKTQVVREAKVEDETQVEKDTQMDNETHMSERKIETSNEKDVAEEKIIEVDWSDYFNGLNGAAVVYEASTMQYSIYNKELAMTQRSPCSTFKIISSFIGLENGVIEPDNSTRTWSREVYWNEKWNNDIDFSEAFHTSCVWYFREVIDDIGKDMMQEELDKLQYGNCDISDWEGRLNTNNNNRALAGFWIESSLKISAKEQVEVMGRIFDTNAPYKDEIRNDLKQVMQVTDHNKVDISIYGKTGTGKKDGILVDAWFTGFAETPHENVYFCVYLGRSDGMNASSSIAKEIAIQIVSDYF